MCNRSRQCRLAHLRATWLVAAILATVLCKCSGEIRKYSSGDTGSLASYNSGSGQLVSGSCAGATNSYPSSENIGFHTPYTSGSGNLGSGSGYGSAWTSSASGYVPRPRQIATDQALGEGIVPPNTTNGAVDMEQDQVATHWTSRLTELGTLASQKHRSDKDLRKYLNYTLMVLLDNQLHEGNERSCHANFSGSMPVSSQGLMGTWIKVLNGAGHLLDILHACFPNSFVGTSDCPAETHHEPNGTQIPGEELDIKPTNRTEQETKTKKPDTVLKQPLADFQSWAHRLEKRFSSFQNASGREPVSTARSNSCNLSQCQIKSLVTHTGALVAATLEVLRLFSNVHNFGVLLSKLRSQNRPSLEGATSNDGSESITDAAYTLNLTVSSLLKPSLIPKSCKSEQFCRDAERTLVYLDRLPFTQTAKKLQLRLVVLLICQNISEREIAGAGADFSGDGNFCPDTGTSVCVHSMTLKCSEDFFIRTSQSHSSFSPEMFHHDYIVRTIGYSLIDRNWSKSGGKPWCRLACKPDLFHSDVLHKVMQITFYVIDALLLILILFACYLIFFNKRNLYRMTRNPRRTYLYLNFVGSFNELFFHTGYYTPAAGHWCNGDGSLVVDSENASNACKFEASIGIAAEVVFCVVLLWLTFTWTRTMINLKRIRPVDDDVFCLGLTVNELLEVVVATMTILMTASIIALPTLGRDWFHLQVEGNPAMRLCIAIDHADSPFFHGSVLFVNIAAGSGFYFFSRAFRKLMQRRMRTCKGLYRTTGQRDNHAAVLKKWLRRHKVFGTVLLFRAILFVAPFRRCCHSKEHTLLQIFGRILLQLLAEFSLPWYLFPQPSTKRNVCLPICDCYWSICA